MAEEAKVKFKVRPGKTHGLMGEYGPGDVVELTPSEAKPFADKLYRLGSSAEVSDSEQARADAEGEAAEIADFEKRTGKKVDAGKSQIEKPKRKKKGDVDPAIPLEEQGDGFEDDEDLTGGEEDAGDGEG